MQDYTQGLLVGVIAAVIIILFLHYSDIIKCSAGSNMPMMMKDVLNKKEGYSGVNLFEQQNSLGVSAVGPEAAYQKLLGFD